jgi:hypothetical protein
MSDQLTIFDLSKATEYIIGDFDSLGIPRIEPKPIGEIRDKFVTALDRILNRPPSPSATGHCLGSVYEAAELVLTGTGGILFIACQGIPIFGHFSLKPRVITSATTETSMFRFPTEPVARFYRDGSLKLNRKGISVHLFMFSAGDPVEVPVVAIPASICSGSAFLYTADTLHKLHGDLFLQLATQWSWASHLQIRATGKAKVVKIFGNIASLSGAKAVSFPVVGPLDTVTVELSIEEPLTENLIVQGGFFWTDQTGRRFLRVFTFVIPVSPLPAVVQLSVDEVALGAVLMKRLTANVVTGASEALVRFKAGAAQLFARGISGPHLYHIMHAISVLPMAAPGPPSAADRKMIDVLATRSSNCVDFLLWIYPRMFALDTNEGPLPLVSESFALGSVFLFHTHASIIIWISQNVDETYLSDAFGVDGFDAIREEVGEFDTVESREVNAKIRECWAISKKYLPVIVIKQGDAREAEMGALIVDTQPANPLANMEAWLREMKRY